MLNDFDSSDDVMLSADFRHNPKQLQIGKLSTHHTTHCQCWHTYRKNKHVQSSQKPTTN